MIYRESEHYDFDEQLDIYGYNFDTTFDTFQEFWNYFFGIEGIDNAIFSANYNISFSRKISMDLIFRKVDTL